MLLPGAGGTEYAGRIEVCSNISDDDGMGNNMRHRLGMRVMLEQCVISWDK